MTPLVLAGAATTLLGVGGLIYCVWAAVRLRQSGLEGEPLATALQRLIPVNLASVFVAAIGLGMVVLGLLVF